MGRPLLSNQLARRLFLHRHGLGETPSGPAHGVPLGALVERLGFVQIDSISTVARAHDLIIHSRRPRYRQGGLARHLERDRGLFEHWTHDAAMIPMGFFPHWRLKHRRDAAAMLQRYRSWRKGDFEALLTRTMTHIETHGACRASDLNEHSAGAQGGWWDWSPTKTALEYLWRSGDLQICHRENFTKHYDLTHRVIPDAFSAIEHDEETSVTWFCDGAIDQLGFATSGEVADFWDVVTKNEARRWAAATDLIEVDVENADGSTRRHFARPDLLQAAQQAPEPPSRLRVLSPFDPALRDRKRAERLFGFNYRIEIFVPEAKRLYGYYVFPLLERDRLVGRIDMKADRKTETLNVTAVWPEPDVKWGTGRQGRLEAELDRVARFAEVKQIIFANGWWRG